MSVVYADVAVDVTQPLACCQTEGNWVQGTSLYTMGLIYRSRWYLLFAQTKYKIMYRYAAKATRTVKKQQQVWLAKKQLCTCSTLFLYISLPLFCTTTTWNFQKLPSHTFYGGNVVRVLVHCRSFSASWPLAFLIFLTPLQNFHVVLPTESFLGYLSLALALPPFFSLSFATCRLLSLFSVLLFPKMPNMWTWQLI